MKHYCAATSVAAFFFLCGLGLGAPRAEASARVNIDPLQVILPARALAASLNIENGKKIPVTFQAELFRWTQVNGRDVLEPSRDLIVTPPIFRIPGEGRQTVRVGRLQRATPEPVEKTYRLVLTEIPPATRQEGTPDTISVALSISLPVFVPPANPQQPTFAWTAGPQGNDLTLAVTNQANTTLRISSLAIQRGDTVLSTRPEPFSVLAGQTRLVPWNRPLPGGFTPGLDLETTLIDERKIVQPLSAGTLPAGIGIAESNIPVPANTQPLPVPPR